MVLQYKVLRTRDLGPRNRDLEVRQSFSKLNTLDSSLIRIRIALRNIFGLEKNIRSSLSAWIHYT